MARRVRSMTAGLAATLLGAGLLTGYGPSAAAEPPSIDVPTDGTAAELRSGDAGPQSFLLRLDTRPAVAAWEGARAESRGAGARAAEQQTARIESLQESVVSDLPAGASEIYRTQNLLAGVAVRADAADAEALGAVRGVAEVLPIARVEQTNATAVPLQGGPQAWEAYGATGEDVTVAIIDSGIDYTHSMFGGPGTTEAFDEASSAAQQTAPSAFPTDKVVGGADLVGDDYAPGDGSDVPVPDDNPVDCDGHGTHVAGTSAGFGVNADGSTYTGAYDEDTPVEDMRIGPGMAPDAALLAYRVFGCAGSSDVVPQAIDLAADPDGDGDFSDAADVMNLSLGSDFGSPLEASSVMVNEASEQGIDMVLSAGNAGDVVDTGGSPGNAVRSIAVAASADATTIVDTLQVGAPDDVAGDYPALRAQEFNAGPDGASLSGSVVNLTEEGNLDGCATYSPEDAARVAGNVVWLEWDNDALPCGSAVRADLAEEAGASGYVFASNSDDLSVGIAGNATVPGVLIPLEASDALRPAMEAETLAVDGVVPEGFEVSDPANTDTLADFSSRGIHRAGNVKPDVAAVGETVTSALVGSGTERLTISGTSMAAPMVAGQTALLRQRRGGWTPEQVKAAIMNTARVDVTTEGDGAGEVYAPNRVGAGRIDVPAALATDVVAYVGGGTGAVSAGFGPLEVPVDDGVQTYTRTIRVQSLGTTARTYDVGYAARTEVPGATYSVSPETVTVPARGSQEVELTLTVDPTELTKTLDPTMERNQLDLPRQFYAAASGLVEMTATGDAPDLRVPVHAAPRPAATLTAPDEVSAPSEEVATQELTLDGAGFDQGAGVDETRSLVAGFQLAATSPELPECTDAGQTDCVDNADVAASDIAAVGLTTDAPQVEAAGGDPLTDGRLYVAMTMHAPWTTPVGQQIYFAQLDVDGDDEADYEVVTERAPETDVLVATTLDLDDLDNPATGGVVDQQPLNDALGDVDTAIFDSDTLVLPVSLAALEGLGADASEVAVATGSASYYGRGPGGQVDATEPATIDALAPGVTLDGTRATDSSALLLDASDGEPLQMRTDGAAYAASGGLGAMIVSFQNQPGSIAQTVDVAEAGANSTTTLEFPPGPARVGQAVTATVTVTGPDGPAPAGGEVEVRSGNQVVGTGTLGEDGTAEVSVVPDRGGDVRFRAAYAGAEGVDPSVSDPVVLRVAQATPNVLLWQTQGTASVARLEVRVGGRGGPASGRIVLRRVTPSGGFVRVRGAALDGDGRVSLRVGRLNRPAEYQVRFLGSDSYRPGESPTRTVGPRR